MGVQPIAIKPSEEALNISEYDLICGGVSFCSLKLLLSQHTVWAEQLEPLTPIAWDSEGHDSVTINLRLCYEIILTVMGEHVIPTSTLVFWRTTPSKPRSVDTAELEAD